MALYCICDYEHSIEGMSQYMHGMHGIDGLC